MKESEIEVFVWRNTAPNKKEEQLIYCVQNLILDSLGHKKLALEETSKMAMTHWKSVIAEAKKNLAHTLKRFNDQDRHYACWLLCGINRQFFELLDGRIPVPNPEVSFDRTIVSATIGRFLQRHFDQSQELSGGP